MRSPLPGMDPYLEHPGLWPDVHNSLIAAIRDELAPRVAPRYFVGIEQRAYSFGGDDLALIGVPDLSLVSVRRPRPPLPAPEAGPGVAVLDVDVPAVEETRETFLVLKRVADRAVVAVIELLSPADKVHPGGREQYLRKRRAILDSSTSLVEIDLHRDGVPMPLADGAAGHDYRVFIGPGPGRPRGRLIAFSVRVPIPSVAVPLLPEDGSVELDLNDVLHRLFERARFDLQLDYGAPPVPPLAGPDADWARDLLDRREPDE